MFASLVSMLIAAGAPTSAGTPLPELPEITTLCTAEGGPIGRFGEVVALDDADEITSAGDPMWWFEEPLGPFDRYSLWRTNLTNRVHTLRYLSPVSDGWDHKSFPRHVARALKGTDWVRGTSRIEGYLPPRWHRTFETANGPVSLTLLADGGLGSLSLYCIHDQMKQIASRENDERRRQVLAAIEQEIAEEEEAAAKRSDAD